MGLFSKKPSNHIQQALLNQANAAINVFGYALQHKATNPQDGNPLGMMEDQSPRLDGTSLRTFTNSPGWGQRGRRTQSGSVACPLPIESGFACESARQSQKGFGQ